MSNIVLDAFYSLGKNINKVKNKDTQETEQGIVSEKLPELKLEMDNAELTKLTQKWNKLWTESSVYAEWSKQGTENENYWLGKHFDNTPSIDKTRPVVDNAIFEALETYLPQVTRRNPEASVEIIDEQEKQDKQLQAFASALQKKLGYIADEIRLRLKLKKSARHWAIYLLGAVKCGWDINRDIPTVKVIRAKKLILDADATVDEDGYTGKYIGEHREMEAAKLLTILESSGGEEEGIKAIKELIGEDTGTEIGFIEWWTDEYMCWTMADKVLLKKKNPHWNYDQEQPAQAVMDEATGQPQLNPETGEPMQGEPQTTPGENHLSHPQIPYMLLSVFNLGLHPVDDTSLMGQNLSGQDTLNKRNKQVDKNIDSMNGGMVVSMERSGLTKEQAKGVTEALRKGGTVVIPSGAPGEAVQRMAASSLPADVFNNIVDTRNRIKDIFGTRGSSAAGLNTERTVRGKILNQTTDQDRIGGGFSEYIEQLADDIYNYLVQLLYVYDNVYANIPNKPKVSISVKEGSLLPKDSTTIANQAMELSTAGKMSTLDMYKRLDYTNPEELAVNAWLEVNAPTLLYADDPRVQQAVQMQQQAAAQANATPEKPPSTSINFKDLPPDGQSQLAEKAGINLHPEAIAAHQELLRTPAPPAEGEQPASPQ